VATSLQLLLSGPTGLSKFPRQTSERFAVLHAREHEWTERVIVALSAMRLFEIVPSNLIA
jgi:hypothetical protein